LDVRRFKADLYRLADRACAKDDAQVKGKVLKIADVLVAMYRKNMVKINHSALELVCARGLITQGYEVKVEHKLDKTLVCDVMGTRGDGAVIVEIETGFIPPEAALEPSSYARSRIASKIARYSRFAGKFALGTTPSYVLEFSPFFLRPPRDRSVVEAAEIKALTDVRYNRPAITIEGLMLARLHSVFLIDVDTGETQQLDPQAYVEAASAFISRRRSAQGLNLQPSPRQRGFNFGESAA
jgi:hypothetical protein